MEKDIFHIAQDIRTPLALAGLVVLVLFLLYRQLITSGAGKSKLASPIAKHLSLLLFWLAITAMLLAVVAYVVPLIRTPPELTIYGKVYSAGDRATPVPGATVFIEANTTQHREADTNGDFAFRLPSTAIGQAVLFYAKAERFVPSKPERLVLQESMGKLEIALAPQERPTLAPPRQLPVPSGRELAVPQNGIVVTRELAFEYPFEPSPGRRTWRLYSSGVWREFYPDGRATEFRQVGRTAIDGCGGTIVRAASGGPLEVFVPDEGCRLDWFRFRQNQGQWSFLGEVVARQ